jgi:hypothetical protein
MLIRLRTRNQVTLPAEAIKSAHVEQGDYFEVESTAEGILLRPKKVIDASQAWFWTPEWQAGEREVDEAAARGEEGRVFASGEEFLEALEKGFEETEG